MIDHINMMRKDINGFVDRFIIEPTKWMVGGDRVKDDLRILSKCWG